MGCDSREALVVVDVVTDLEPGVDFVGVEVEVTREGGRLGGGQVLAEATDWTAPVRIAEVAGVPPGDISVRATLLAPLGEVVLTRAELVPVMADRVVTLVLGSLCIGVQCPGGVDAPDATECVGGVCVPPNCPTCAPSCVTDAECPASAACGTGLCIEASCLYPDGAGRCSDGEICHPTLGCTGPSCECDDDDPCTRDYCEEAACLHEPRDGASCNDGVFCNGADTCTAGACASVGPPPCEASLCDETAERCNIGCADTSDCPDDVLGAWRECVHDDTCSRGGTRSRDVTSFTCVAGNCEPTSTEETDGSACARETDGESCGEDSCGSWTTCRYATCQTTGSRSRNCAAPRCADGSCDPNTSRETDSSACTRSSQEGMRCSPSGSFCSGTCSGGSCGDLCAYCSGTCTAVGCYGPGDGGVTRCD